MYIFYTNTLAWILDTDCKTSGGGIDIDPQ